MEKKEHRRPIQIGDSTWRVLRKIAFDRETTMRALIDAAVKEVYIDKEAGNQQNTNKEG